MPQIETNPENLSWTSEDEAKWNSFLQSPTGGRLLSKLAEGIPPLFEEGDKNKIFIRQGVVLGYQRSLRMLVELTHSPPKPPEPNNYPPLDDDTQWDGDKPKDR